MMSKVEGEKPDGFIVPVLQALLNLPSQRALAKALGVSSGFICKAKREPGTSLSQRRLETAINLLRATSPPIEFALRDFQLKKEEFLEHIPNDHPRYLAAREAAGLQPLTAYHEAFDRMPLLVGKYMRLFLCRDPEDQNIDALAVDDFIITKGSRPNEALIEQTTYEFETYIPRGTVRIRDDTIEIRIDYGNPRHPNGVFLAPFPRGNEVQCILTLNLDIKYHSRLVAARPMLFVRVDDFFEKEEFYGPKTRIFRTLKKVLEKSIQFNRVKYEFIALAVPEDGLAQIIGEVNRLKEEAARSLKPHSSKDAEN